MKKPELLVTPTSIAHIVELIEAGADAFIVGEQQFGLRLAGEFSLEEVKEAAQLVRAANRKIYVAVNGLFHNDRIDALEQYMIATSTMPIDGYVYGDPGVITICREQGITVPLHWNPETTATNWFTANYWGERGATRAVLARELSLDEVIEIKENANVAVEVQVHGMTCMFQSKRSLLGHYFLYQDKVLPIENRTEAQNMFLHDDERNNKYPIYEDINGTHIFSPNDMCLIDELEELLEANIDVFKIDGVLHSTNYITTVTKLYRRAIDAYANGTYDDERDALRNAIDEIQPATRPLDTGFIFKETVY